MPPREAEHLFHGDRVRVDLSRSGQIRGIEVVEHSIRELIGRFDVEGGRLGSLIYERKQARELVPLVSVATPQGPRPGDWIRVELEYRNRGALPVVGHLREIYGQDLPASADITMVAAELGLKEKHSAEAIAEAQAHRLHLAQALAEPGRRDLRKIPFVTIDGETARDFDDAVAVEAAAGGGFVLWVAIADVSYYVREGGAIDAEARERGTSVYFPERAFHMLPSALSENLCSLRPNEPRLAFAARMEIAKDGTRQQIEIYPAVIESRRRATYTEIQAEIDALTAGKPIAQPAREPANLRVVVDLYRRLREFRVRRGSLDFDLPESQVQVDSTGEPTAIVRTARLDAHRLIEEFMICANEAVTEWMLKRGKPFVYRIHDTPSPESLDRFSQLAKAAGVRFQPDPKRSLQHQISEFIASLEGKPASEMLNMALLRAMKQAVYASVHGIHFGLASTAYTHFTSPIRRYPDLVVHRLLKGALLGAKSPPPAELTQITEHCSYRERVAQEAERESRKIKQTRLMRRHLGDEFEGKIVGLGERGLYVQLIEPFVEGFVPSASLKDDLYEFDERKMQLVGRKRRRVFGVGQPVRIRVVRADLERRQVEFELRD